MSEQIKAVGLLSGGLDSTLAAKMMLEQGIEVHAINFTSPFCTCTPKTAGCAAVVTAVKQLGNIPLKHMGLGDDYLDMLMKPKHGYGKGMNPCIDCRALKVRHAGIYMEEIGAKFMFTGEVLGQRPMSQHRKAIDIIDRDSGYAGLILRPLSARHFEPTTPEREGWVDREKLLALEGRGRRPQIHMAEEMGIANYPCPAGGCLLTDRNFADRLRDYFDHTDTPSLRDMPLLKCGRHFRLANGDKVIVSRDQAEGERLTALFREEWHLFTPVNFAGPDVILQGSSIDEALAKLVEYTRQALPESPAVIHRHSGDATPHPLSPKRA